MYMKKQFFKVSINVFFVECLVFFYKIKVYIKIISLSTIPKKIYSAHKKRCSTQFSTDKL